TYKYLTNYHFDVKETHQADVEDIHQSKDGKYIAFATNENGLSVPHVLDTKTTREIELPKLPDGQIDNLVWHNNSKDLAFNVTNARSPSDVYSLNIDKGAIQRWTRSETGGIDTSSLVEPQLVIWKSFDGLEISGFLYRPPARFTGKRPVVISIHGGPEGQFR